MALAQRVLNVSFLFPNNEQVDLDASLNLRVNIEKNVLAIQNRCDIEVTNMNSVTRAQLLTQFTAWYHNQATQGNVDQQIVQVVVTAGYDNVAPTQIFVGEVAQCQMTQQPPNVTMRIMCYTRQVDRTKLETGSAPIRTTYKAYVEWAVQQMNKNLLPNQQPLALKFNCNDAIANATIDNPGAGIYHMSALMYDIQDYYKPDAVAFIDDLTLVVNDKDKAVNPDEVTSLDEFVGIPGWTEWGVEATVLFVPTIRLATLVKLTSTMNPQVSNDDNSSYLVTRINYELSSREEPFYVKFQAMPAAAAAQ